MLLSHIEKGPIKSNNAHILHFFDAKCLQIKNCYVYL